MKKRLFWLALWLVGILFPMGWLRRLSPAFRQRFDAIFSPEWMHWLMHAALFAILVVLLAYVLARKIDRRAALIIIGCVLLVGVFQEGFQWATASTVLGWNSLFDLGVDLVGGAAGLIFVGVWDHRQR